MRSKVMIRSLIIPVAAGILFCNVCAGLSAKPKETAQSNAFLVQIDNKPLTYCNPLDVIVGSERARRGGEPVVVLFKDNYYLFVTGSKGYWISPNMRDWAYTDAPNFPSGVVSVASNGQNLFACVMNQKDVFQCVGDPKEGKWEKAGTFDSDRYGDADMFFDDDGRLYMYYGWSQILPFRVVELDPKTFKEIGKPVTCFFGNHDEHGFERRRAADVIFPFFDHRPYFAEEYPWIEGPWMVKYNNKYYLQYAAIGLEFLSYSQGVYMSDSPMGPFTYSPNNPLAFKTTGFAPGAGHGSTFKDKNGQFWTICMIPSYYGGSGGAELAMYPTAIDSDGIMHSNTAFGDYPQYYPGIKKDAVDNNSAKWLLLSQKKAVQVSSTLEKFGAANAVDENFMTFWCAKTGDAGEYMTIDLGKTCDVCSLQVNWDRYGSTVPLGRGFGAAPALDRYQSYTVEVSTDNQHWTTIVDKTNNKEDRRHDYTELASPVKARYVKLTNAFTPDGGKFAVKDLRVFGNPSAAKFTKVNDVKVVRNPDDTRDATLLWNPVAGADGYVVRYGIAAGKLYNNYMVYDANTITIHSLNKGEKYVFEVTAFDSGTDYYRENVAGTMGRGAEIELSKGKAAGGYGAPNPSLVRKMTYEGVDDYVFDNITPDTYSLGHTFGPMLWTGTLTEADLIGTGDKPTVTATLEEFGAGTKTLGHIVLKVYPGEKSGKIVVSFENK